MKLEGLAEKPAICFQVEKKNAWPSPGVLAMKPEIILFDEPFSHLDFSRHSGSLEAYGPIASARTHVSVKTMT